MATNDPGSDADGPIGHPGDELTASLARTDSGTTVCTIYPVRVEDEAETTTWLSAEEGSFVHVSNYR